jgi:transcriptional regulator with XRE-family HTH domain
MIGEKLVLLRKLEGITQEELATKLDVAANTISYYESNQRVPSVEILIKIADHFETSVDFLLNREKFNIIKSEFGLVIQQAIKLKINPEKLNRLIECYTFLITED